MNLGMDARFPLDFSFDILRRVLDEESLVLAQLAYIVGNLHDPILQSCGHGNVATGPWRSHGNNKSNAVGTKQQPAILRFAQYWELFANIATLHGAQSTIVEKLEEVVNNRTHLLDQQQGQKKEVKSGHGAAGNLHMRSSSSSSSSSDGRTDEGMRGPQSILELFCSAAMRHYIAEHMMYSLNYSRNIAPRVMELWRLWRCRCGKNTNAHLSARERQELESYMEFLYFLWHAFGGEDGVPDDPRVIFTRLPETLLVKSQKPKKDRAGHNTAVVPVKMPDAPSIPPNWRGFETLLVLLATPLASLRRYMHVARCIIESQSLPIPVRQRLQVDFVDLLVLRLAEEHSIVFDELAKQDISHIMALIDEVSSPAPSEAHKKKFPRIRLDEDGSRTLVHYGRLIKRFRRGRHERLVFLFSDWLCYVEEQTNGRMRLRASISLESLRVVELDDTAEVVNGFDIVTKDMRLTFFAPTLEQKRQWVDALRNTTEAYKVKVQQLASPRRQDISQQQQQQQQKNKSLGHLACQTRVTALPLSHNSRLRRQQRADHALQRRLERRSTAELATTNSLVADETPAPVMGTDAERKQPALSFRPLHGNFDVTYWAQQSTETVHKRVRSSDLLRSSWALQSPHDPNACEPKAVAPGMDPLNHGNNSTTTDAADCSVHSADAPASAGHSPTSPRVPPRAVLSRLLSERFQEPSLPPLYSGGNANSPLPENVSENEGREEPDSLYATLLSCVATTEVHKYSFAAEEDEVVLENDEWVPTCDETPDAIRPEGPAIQISLKHPVGETDSDHGSNSQSHISHFEEEEEAMWSPR
ncbi:putative PH domain containing protein [Trypanosoma cruzi]|nr:putative PH domain containing protein [Trypanosoma cruzi]